MTYDNDIIHYLVSIFQGNNLTWIPWYNYFANISGLCSVNSEVCLECLLPCENGANDITLYVYMGLVWG